MTPHEIVLLVAVILPSSLLGVIVCIMLSAVMLKIKTPDEETKEKTISVGSGGKTRARLTSRAG